MEQASFVNTASNSLMDKFEMSFQLSLSFLTKEEQAASGTDKGKNYFKNFKFKFKKKLK